MLFAELDSGQCGYFFVFLAIGDSRVFLLNENQKKKLDNKQQTVLVYGKMEADNGLDLIFEGYSCLVKCHQRGSYEY